MTLLKTKTPTAETFGKLEDVIEAVVTSGQKEHALASVATL